MEKFANDYTTTLNGSINNSVTSLVVTSATGAPAANFRIRIEDELLLVTAVAGTTLTVTRGVEGTTAASHADLSTVTHVLTAAGLMQAMPSEIDYVEITSSVNPTATSEATANTIVTASAVAFDGVTTVMIEFFSPLVRPGTAATNTMQLCLYDGSSSIGFIAQTTTPAANADHKPFFVSRRLTPSAATHTYSIRGFVNTGTGLVAAGTGGSGQNVPAFIRITRVA